MRVAVIHNLPPGGARRRLAGQIPALGGEVFELCLGTAAPVTSDATVISYAPHALRVPPAVRPALRYGDLVRLSLAWRRVARELERLRPDVVFANPCRYSQAPAALARSPAPSLYFCDEPRRVDYESAARATLNPATRRLYAPLRAAERRLDRRGVAAASALVTNSRFTAAAIAEAYGRRAEVVPLGVPERFRPTGNPPGEHLLSVGALIAGKGHDLVVGAAALARRRRRVIVVTPRPDRAGSAHLEHVAREAGVELELRVGIGDDELRTLYSTAFATLYLARSEPLGLASLEAQACGCPVVVADEGGLPETIVVGRTGLAVRRDAGAAAVALDELEEPNRRQAISAAAAAHGAAATWARSGEEISRRLVALIS